MTNEIKFIYYWILLPRDTSFEPPIVREFADLAEELSIKIIYPGINAKTNMYQCYKNFHGYK